MATINGILKFGRSAEMRSVAVYAFSNFFSKGISFLLLFISIFWWQFDPDLIMDSSLFSFMKNKKILWISGAGTFLGVAVLVK